MISCWDKQFAFGHSTQGCPLLKLTVFDRGQFELERCP